MKKYSKISARVLPTVIALSLVILIAMFGIIALWEQENCRVQLAMYRHICLADLESAYTFYCNVPLLADTMSSSCIRLYDSMPYGDTHINVKPWGLYDAVFLATPDSMFCQCRLTGVRASAPTLYYADNGSVLTIAGRCELQGKLQLPSNGLKYGRMRNDIYNGNVVSQSFISRAEDKMPTVQQLAIKNVRELLKPNNDEYTLLPDSVCRSFIKDSTLYLHLNSATVSNCCLRGNIYLYADELHIDSTCRMKNIIICARTVSIANGTNISAQIFARDTIIIGKRCALEYPSGIYTESYAEVGDYSTINGYAIIRSTLFDGQRSPSYKQSVTARIRGLLWVEGCAQVQGIVSGRAVLERADLYTPHGYYKDMMYNITILENDATVQPKWINDDTLRKEVVWLD